MSYQLVLQQYIKQCVYDVTAQLVCRELAREWLIRDEIWRSWKPAEDCIFSIAFKLNTHAAATMCPQQHWWPESEQAILNKKKILNFKPELQLFDTDKSSMQCAWEIKAHG